MRKSKSNNNNLCVLFGLIILTIIIYKIYLSNNSIKEHFTDSDKDNSNKQCKDCSIKVNMSSL
jgi:hypothetical protein